jgi:hypothetical protein
LEQQAAAVQRAAEAATGLSEGEVVALRESLRGLTASLRAAASH